MWKRISLWEQKFLNIGSSFILIKSVLSSTPLHVLKFIGAPHMVFLRIHKLFNRFFGAQQMISRRFIGILGKIIAFLTQREDWVLGALRMSQKLLLCNFNGNFGHLNELDAHCLKINIAKGSTAFRWHGNAVNSISGKDL